MGGKEIRKLALCTNLKCNNNCVFCYQADKRGYKEPSLNFLKSKLKLNRKICNELCLSGGETTLREGLFDLIAYAKKLEYNPIEVQSNGRLYSLQPFVQKITKFNNLVFHVSIHGATAKVNDKLTRVPGSFSQTVNGIKNLVAKHQNVVCYTVITKQNMHQLVDIVKRFHNLGIEHAKFASVHPEGNAYTNFDTVVPKISILKPKLVAAIRKSKELGIKLIVGNFPFCTIDNDDCLDNYNVFEVIHSPYFNFKGNVNKERKRLSKVKAKQCKSCTKDKFCEGIWKEYADVYGTTELVPIK